MTLPAVAGYRGQTFVWTEDPPMSDLLPPEDDGFDAELRISQSLSDVLDPLLREVGLYIDQTQMQRIENGPTMVMVDCLVGDVAFTDRVQRPEQHDMDAEFRVMQRDLEEQRFADTKKALQEGTADLWGDD